MYYGYTGPVPGYSPKDLFNRNLNIEAHNAALDKANEEHIRRIELGNRKREKNGLPPRAYPLPEGMKDYVVGSCLPDDSPTCAETFARDWMEFSSYHSHPNNGGWSGSDGDAGYVKGKGRPLWVTRGDPGTPPEGWTTEQLTPLGMK